MSEHTSTSIGRSVVVFVGVVLMVVAFLRGNYLLGPACGVVYALVVAAIAWLFAKPLTRTGTASLFRWISLFLFAVPVGYVMAFPAVMNSDVQHLIDKQATDRTVRAELNQLFDSDTAFSGLSISTTHLKVVNVTISGALSTRDDLQRLRNSIARECPTLKLCPLHWDILLRDTDDHLQGLDQELFPSPG